VTLIMELMADALVEVKVVERAPLVSTTTSNVKEVFDVDFVESTASSSRSTGERRALISLAPPPAYRRPALAPELPAALASGHNLTFVAVAPETLASSPMTRRVALGTWKWPVTVTRRLMPAVRPEAYLVAALRSPAATVLPAGDAVLAMDGQPVGRARLELIRPGEPFTLPLGIDHAVRATRRVQLDSSQVGLISKDDVNRYTVTVDVANPHRRAVAVEIVDQVPRARDDSVEVKLESTTAGAKVDEQGTLTWRTTLAAGATAQLRFVYVLIRPKGNRLHQ
jgi:uncharacterized protein (TIGR02231 family)